MRGWLTLLPGGVRAVMIAQTPSPNATQVVLADLNQLVRGATPRRTWCFSRKPILGTKPIPGNDPGMATGSTLAGAGGRAALALASPPT